MTAIILHTGRPVSYPQPHDPDSSIWYVMIWDQVLADQQATITSGVWRLRPAASAPPEEGEMVIVGTQIGIDWTVDGTVYHEVCVVKLSGGTVGEKYTITCQVTTSAGETFEKSFILTVSQN